MREGYQIRKDDAAACLTAALLSAIYHHWHDGKEVSQKFVTELCEMLADEETSRIEVLTGLVKAAEDSFFHVVFWLYGQIESRKITAAQIFCLLGKYGAQKDNDGQLVLTKPGSGESFFSLL